MAECLSFEPEDRPASAESVRETLTAIVRASPSEATVPPARRRAWLRNPLWWIVKR